MAALLLKLRTSAAIWFSLKLPVLQTCQVEEGEKDLVVAARGTGVKQVMLKHLKELMADTSTYWWEPYNGVWLQQLKMEGLSRTMLSSHWSIDVPWSGIQLDPAFPDLRHHQHLDRTSPMT